MNKQERHHPSSCSPWFSTFDKTSHVTDIITFLLYVHTCNPPNLNFKSKTLKPVENKISVKIISWKPNIARQMHLITFRNTYKYIKFIFVQSMKFFFLINICRVKIMSMMYLTIIILCAFI